MMADLLVVPRFGVAAVLLPSARERSMSASVRPAPKAPIFRKLRRLRPSQKRCLLPRIVSMVGTPLKKADNRGRRLTIVLVCGVRGNCYFQFVPTRPHS